MSDLHVLVVGGGISGLATAWWLTRLGADVQVWEASQRPGGKIRTRHGDGFVSEESAALLMGFRPEVGDLIDGAGLAGARLPRSPSSKRYLVKDAGLVEVPVRLGDMLTSSLWSLRGKLRLLAEPFITRGGHDAESVSEFVTRRLGHEVAVRAMEPYVSGPLASDPDLAEARSVLPRLTGLERNYGSITAGVIAHRAMRRRTACAPQGFSFAAGMQSLVDALAAELGPRLHLGRRVDAIEPDNGPWRVHGSAGGRHHGVVTRHVVLCSPADASARLLAPVDQELSELLHGIDYAPVSVVHLGFDRDAVAHPLDGAGFLVPRNESRALTGCLWTSSMFSARAPARHVVLTCYLGGARRPQVCEWDDHHCSSAALDELDPLLGLRSEPCLVRVHRHGRALPLYHGAYQARLGAMDARLCALQGLHLEGNYRGGVSVQDRIACGRSIAARIVEEPAAGRVPLASTCATALSSPALAAEPATGS